MKRSAVLVGSLIFCLSTDISHFRPSLCLKRIEEETMMKMLAD